MPSAACALASVRKFGFASRFTSAQRRLGRSIKRCRTAGSSNWRSAALFLGVSPGCRHRHLAGQPLQFGEHARARPSPTRARSGRELRRDRD